MLTLLLFCALGGRAQSDVAMIVLKIITTYRNETMDYVVKLNNKPVYYPLDTDVARNATESALKELAKAHPAAVEIKLVVQCYNWYAWSCKYTRDGVVVSEYEKRCRRGRL